MKKETVAVAIPAAEVVAAAPVVETNDKKTPIILTTTELATMLLLVAKSHKNPSDIEKAQLEGTIFQPNPEVLESLAKKGDNNTKLVTESDGVYTVTPFGTKWCLASRTFGFNFKSIFADLNVPALHSAFFLMADELEKRHEKSCIYFLDREGQQSRFWSKFNDAVGKVDSCLEAEPEAEIA